jgi:hypothetical protein
MWAIRADVAAPEDGRTPGCCTQRYSATVGLDKRALHPYNQDMQDDWTQAVHREYTGGDLRFDFPVRPLGPVRLVGVLLIGFSVLFVWQPAHGLWPVLSQWLHGSSGGAEGLFNLFLLPFCILGLIPATIGLLILFGRCRVEWKDGRLRAAEVLGPFHRTRRLPRKSIVRLEVGGPAAMNRGGASGPQPVNLPNFSVLTAVFEDGTKKLLLLGYPKEWLLGVAGELKSCVGGTAASSTPVQVVENPFQNANDEDVLNQPAGSRVQMVEGGSSLRLNIPPAGLWRGSRGFILFPLAWCGFIMVITVALYLDGLKKEGPVWGYYILIPLFWIIGLGLLAITVNLGRRSTELSVEGRQLLITTKELFGIKQRSWSRDDLAAIRADRSGMEVNDRPVIELQIHPRLGKKAGFLAGRDEAELRWLATRLRQALQVPARTA